MQEGFLVGFGGVGAEELEDERGLGRAGKDSGIAGREVEEEGTGLRKGNRRFHVEVYRFNAGIKGKWAICTPWVRLRMRILRGCVRIGAWRGIRRILVPEKQ